MYGSVGLLLLEDQGTQRPPANNNTCARPYRTPGGNQITRQEHKRREPRACTDLDLCLATGQSHHPIVSLPSAFHLCVMVMPWHSARAPPVNAAGTANGSICEYAWCDLARCLLWSVPDITLFRASAPASESLVALSPPNSHAACSHPPRSVSATRCDARECRISQDWRAVGATSVEALAWYTQALA